MQRPHGRPILAGPGRNAVHAGVVQEQRTQATSSPSLARSSGLKSNTQKVTGGSPSILAHATRWPAASTATEVTRSGVRGMAVHARSPLRGAGFGTSVLLLGRSCWHGALAGTMALAGAVWATAPAIMVAAMIKDGIHSANSLLARVILSSLFREACQKCLAHRSSLSRFP